MPDEPQGHSAELENTSTSAADVGLSPGTVLDEKFRVERLLGIGGMGAVYEITHELTRHRRALKLLHPHYAVRKQVVDRFLREASAAGRIGNTHIVETFDAGWLKSGEPYLVMELLEGRSLADHLAQSPRGLPLAEWAEIFAQACDGLQAAHDAGIVHRDLKPDNIFLCPEDSRWFVKILDFGVSKFDGRHTASSQQTAQGAFVGTPAYMSPEQFEDGAEVDARSDVYSLGVILYEALVGEHPYPASSLAQLARKIASAEIAPPSECRADLPATIDALMAEVLCKDREQRRLTAAALATQLQGLAGNAPPAVDPFGPTGFSQAPPAAADDEAGGELPGGAAAATTRRVDAPSSKGRAPLLWVGAAAVLVGGAVAVSQLGEDALDRAEPADTGATTGSAEPAPKASVVAEEAEPGPTAEPAGSTLPGATAPSAVPRSTAPPTGDQPRPPQPSVRPGAGKPPSQAPDDDLGRDMTEG